MILRAIFLLSIIGIVIILSLIVSAQVIDTPDTSDPGQSPVSPPQDPSGQTPPQVDGEPFHGHTGNYGWITKREGNVIVKGKEGKGGGVVPTVEVNWYKEYCGIAWTKYLEKYFREHWNEQNKEILCARDAASLCSTPLNDRADFAQTYQEVFREIMNGRGVTNPTPASTTQINTCINQIRNAEDVQRFCIKNIKQLQALNCGSREELQEEERLFCCDCTVPQKARILKATNVTAGDAACKEFCGEGLTSSQKKKIQSQITPVQSYDGMCPPETPQTGGVVEDELRIGAPEFSSLAIISFGIVLLGIMILKRKR